MRLSCLAAALALLPLAHLCAAEEPAYDLVIRNGRLLDGQGNPWVQRGRRHQGRQIRQRSAAWTGRGTGARSTPTASTSRPDWIDMMDQSGEVLLKNGLAENKVREGVTTAIAGEGGTPVPSARHYRNTSPSCEAGHLPQLRHLLQLSPGARGGHGRCGWQTLRRANGRNESARR